MSVAAEIQLVNSFMRVRHRSKTEVGLLDYISPWRSQDTGRQELQFLISKNKILEEIALTKLKEPQPTQPNPDQEKKATLSPKRTFRTHDKTLNDFHRYQQKRCGELIICKTEVARAKAKSMSRQSKDEKLFDKLIFVKKFHPDLHRPKVVTVGKCEAQVKQQTSFMSQSVYFWEGNSQPKQKELAPSRNHYKPKLFQLRRQSVYRSYQDTEHSKEKQITMALLHKVNSMENQSQHHNSTTQQLSRTLKNFLNLKQQI